MLRIVQPTRRVPLASHQAILSVDGVLSEASVVTRMTVRQDISRRNVKKSIKLVRFSKKNTFFRPYY